MVNQLAEIKIRVIPQCAGYVFKYILSDLVKFRIGLENFKGVFTRVWLILIVMTSNQLSFGSVEMDKNYSLFLPWRKRLCHRWSCDKLQPGSFSQ